MQIEFQNCSLEIGYIGTPDGIVMVMLRDACQAAADAIVDFSRRFVTMLAEAFERSAANLSTKKNCKTTVEQCVCLNTTTA